MTWWGWVIGGAILLGAELAFVDAQFYLVFVGTAAIIDGDQQRVIKASEANRQQQINEAEGQAEAMLRVAAATSQGLSRIASALL